MPSIMDLSNKYSQMMMSPVTQPQSPNMSSIAGPSVDVPPPAPVAPAPAQAAKSVYSPPKAQVKAVAPPAPVAPPVSVVDQEAINNYTNNTNKLASALDQGTGNTQAPAPAAPPQAPADQKTGNSSILDFYGLGDKGTTPADLYSMYGVEKPTYTAPKTPDTSAADSLIAKYQPTYDPKAIQEGLSADLQAINDRAVLAQREAKRVTENERMANISNLSSLGFSNPASSGMASIGSASEDSYNRRVDAINTMAAAEKAEAESKWFERGSQQQKDALAFAQGLKKEALDKFDAAEKSAKDAYDRNRNAMMDQVNIVNSVVDSLRTQKSISRQEKLDAQNSVKDLISNFGTGLFEGMKEQDLTDLETAAGYSKGALTNSITKLKEAEMKAKNNEKNKFELKTLGKDLYIVYPNKLDDAGRPTKELFIKGKETGSGGSSSGAGTYFTRPKADGTIGYYYGSSKKPEAAQELTIDQYRQGSKVGAAEENPDDTTVELLISTAVDAKGNFNASKIPAANRNYVLKRADELGLFDAEEDTKSSFWDWFN